MPGKLPDIQKDQKPQVMLPIQKVGIIGEKHLLHLYSKYRAKTGENPEVDIYCDISVSTNLSPSIKGTHMSRLIEMIDKEVAERHASLEDFAEKLARSTFHSLIDIGLTQATVEVSGDMAIEKRAPISDLCAQEIITLCAKATFDGTSVRRGVGVSVPILLVCPCAQELIKSRVHSNLLKEDLDESLVQRICDLIPMPSHNQRGHVSISVETPPNIDVDVRDLADIVHQKLNQVYSVLKREDELEVVYRAHLNPTLVEDACREVAYAIYNFLEGKLRAQSIVKIQIVSEESIHQHDAFAEMEMSFEQLKNFVELSKRI